MDLLTVVTHELGHLLGYGDTSAPGIMAGTLASGVRLMPEPALSTDVSVAQSLSLDASPSASLTITVSIHPTFSSPTLVTAGRAAQASDPIAQAVNAIFAAALSRARLDYSNPEAWTTLPSAISVPAVRETIPERSTFTTAFSSADGSRSVGNSILGDASGLNDVERVEGFVAPVLDDGDKPEQREQQNSREGYSEGQSTPAGGELLPLSQRPDSDRMMDVLSPAVQRGRACDACFVAEAWAPDFTATSMHLLPDGPEDSGFAAETAVALAGLAYLSGEWRTAYVPTKQSNRRSVFPLNTPRSKEGTT